jgi:hypothetical protein
VKYARIDAQRREFPQPDLCDVLAVSISGYRAWRRGGTPDRTRRTDPQAVALMKSIHTEVKAAYGSRHTHRELQGRGHRIGLRRVERLMRENGIRARHQRRLAAMTDSKHSMPVAPNLLPRDFTPEAPNRVWTGDITHIQTGEGWLYMAMGAGPVQPRNHRLVDQAEDDRQAHRVRHDRLDEPKGQLLGQRAHRELLQQPEERAGAWHDLCDKSRRAGRLVRVHRGVLQPESPPLHAGLLLAASVPGELDQQACG